MPRPRQTLNSNNEVSIENAEERSYELPISALRNINQEIVQDVYMIGNPIQCYDRVMPHLVDIYKMGLSDAQRTVVNPKIEADVIVMAYEKEKELKNFIFDIIEEQFQKYVPKEECEEVINKIEKH